MKGSREILVSFFIAVTSLCALVKSREYLNNTSARNVNPEVATQLSGATEDPALTLNWGLQRIGVEKAWQKSRGQREVVVAVIDTGADIAHPRLKDSVWRNPGETGLDENGMSKATNGFDDDDNGYVDDVHGWNFVTDSPEVMDDHGHGTHVAGIISGSSGVAPGVSLMILKYYDAQNSGSQNMASSVRALRYAIRMGATIINYSGGGVFRNEDEYQMLEWARREGLLVVAAAGNEGVNSDFFHFYPANYELPNILSVTATTREDQILNGSNFGTATVDIAAPGKNIYSTLPGGNYGFMSGTSQATAFVSGIAALLLSSEPELRRPEDLIEHILARGERHASLNGKTRGARLAHAGAALSGNPRQLAQASKTQPLSNSAAKTF